MIIRKTKLKYCGFLFLITGIVLLTSKTAHALTVTGFLSGTLMQMMDDLFSAILRMLIIMLSGLGDALTWVLRLRVYSDMPVVTESWKVVRDFSNMLFIVALIVMAFATIFDISRYNFKSLIAKFLIAAVLINFSLVIGGVIVDGSQTLSNVFLTSIGNAGDRIGQSLCPSILLGADCLSSNLTTGGDNSSILSFAGRSLSWLAGPPGVAAYNYATGSNADLTWQIVLKTFFSIIITSIAIFSLATIFVMALIRIPIIWLLLVLSPIAWITYVLPATSGANKMWWKYFIGWNLFMPVFLFFLSLGLYFLQSQQQIIATVFSQGTPIAVIGFPLQVIFLYFLTAFILIGGTTAALKSSFIAGSGVVSMTKWSKGFLWRMPGMSSIGAAGYAARQRAEQVRKEGIGAPGSVWNRLYGGEAGVERQRTRWGERFGVSGSDLKAQKDFVARADKEIEGIQEKYNSGKIDAEGIYLAAKRFDASTVTGFAYGKMAAKLGKLDSGLMSKSVSQLQRNPYALQEFVKTAKESKFSNVDGKELTKMAAAEGDYGFMRNMRSVRGEIYKHLQSDPKILSGISEQQFLAGLNTFGGYSTAEGKEFLKKTGEVRPDYSLAFNLNNQEPKNKLIEGYKKVHGDDSLDRLSNDEINRRLSVQFFSGTLSDAKNVVNYDLDKVWMNSYFQEALKNQLSAGSDKARRSYVTRLENMLRTARRGNEKIAILQEIVSQLPGDSGGQGNNNPGGGGQGGGRPTGRGTSNYPRGQVGFRPQPNTTGVSSENILDLSPNHEDTEQTEDYDYEGGENEPEENNNQ